MPAIAVPHLGPSGRDPMTGAAAPPERRGKLQAGVTDLGNGYKLHSLSQRIRLVGDFWQPGDPDGGIEVTPSGRVLPRIDHIQHDLETTDLKGAGLDMDDHQLELSRRVWYATLMRTAPRLTPLHHILGQSDPRWHKSLHPRDVPARDDWRAGLWTPDALAQLQETHRGIYEFRWESLPTDRILAPLRRKLERARREGRHDAEQLQRRFDRATAELETIILLATGRGAEARPLSEIAAEFDHDSRQTGRKQRNPGRNKATPG